MEKLSPIGELLFEYHLLYQQKEKRAVLQKDFAEHIGIDVTLYNHFYRGRRLPNAEQVRHLAEFFEDLRFYDAAGMERPDERLFLIQIAWKRMPETKKKKLAEDAAPYITKE